MMIVGWSLLCAAAFQLIAHAYITGGVEAGLMMSAICSGGAGLWLLVDGTHDKLHEQRMAERVMSIRRIGHE